MKTQHYVSIDGEPLPVTVESADGRRYLVRLGEQQIALEAHEVGPRQYHLLGEDGQVHDLVVAQGAAGVEVHHRSGTAPVQILDETQLARQALSSAGAGRRAKGEVAVEAPMPGRVVKALVTAGELVEEGQGVIVVEAMKMENELRSPVSGKVKAIEVADGADVEAGCALVLIDAGGTDGGS